MRTSTCLLALSSLWLLAAAAGALPKKLEKKSIANSLAPQAVEPVEQKLDAPSAKISDEALMESPGETVDRAKKQASTTFCVEVRQNKPTYVDCNDAGSSGNKVIVVQGNEDGSGPNGGMPGPGGLLGPSGPNGPHSMHLPHGLHHLPHHGVHFSGPGTGSATNPDGTPALIHYLFPGGGDGPGALGPNAGFGPNGLPFNLPGGMGGGPHDGGLNGILFQLPGGFPGDSSGSSGLGPNGIHVNVHPNAGFPGGPGGPGAGPGGQSPNGVHFHLPGGSGGAPGSGGGSSATPIHLSGIECLCAGVPAQGRDGENNDGTPSNEALAVKFLQDLQKNDKPDVDSQRASNGDQQTPTDQPSGVPTIVLPKSAGMPYALPMMFGGMPLMRTGYYPYLPYGLTGDDSMPYLRAGSGSKPTVPSTDVPPASEGAPASRTSLPSYGSPYGSHHGLLPMMGGMPLMRASGGMPVMMRVPMMGGMPLMGGMPMMMAKSSDSDPKQPGVPIMIQVPSATKPGEDPRNPMAPNGAQLPIMSMMPMAKAAEDPKNPTAPNGMPLAIMGMPMAKAGEDPQNPTAPNGVPLAIMHMPVGKAVEDPKNPTAPNGVPLAIVMGKAGEKPTLPPMMPSGTPMGIMPFARAGDNPMTPTLPNGVPLPLAIMSMLRAGENPTVPTLPNGAPLPMMLLPGMRADDPNLPMGGKIDPSMTLRHYPGRPLQYPGQTPGYGMILPQTMYPTHGLPGLMGGGFPPHHHGYGLPHRAQPDCLQDSFQSVPSLQGLRFSRGPDESEVPPPPAAGQQQADAEDAEGPAGSEHAEPDDKEGRISHFAADERDDAVNAV